VADTVFIIGALIYLAGVPFFTGLFSSDKCFDGGDLFMGLVWPVMAPAIAMILAIGLACQQLFRAGLWLKGKLDA